MPEGAGVRVGTLSSMPEANGRVASVLDGRYELRSVIGAGGMATVWQGYDRRLRRPVAVKVIAEGLAHDPGFVQRFEREAQHVAALSHPGIVTVFDFGTEGDRAFLVMEYVRGSTLRALLAAAGTLSVDDTFALARAVLLAVEHAHAQGIVHRDLKPANILLTTSGNVKVADFGVAKAVGQSTAVTLDGTVVGTAAYSSPEQLSGADVGPTTDLYSLGCVLYECLGGSPPFSDEHLGRLVLQQSYARPAAITDVRPDAPPGLAAAIERSLEKDPSARFASASAMLDAVEQTARCTLGHGLPHLSVEPPVLQADTARMPAGFPDDLTDVARGIRDHDTLVDQRTGRAVRSSGWHRRRRLLAGAGVAAIVAGGIGAVLASQGGVGHHPRGARTPAAADRATLPTGGLLEPGQSLRSRNGRFRLEMERDGNLVEVETSGDIPIWQTATTGNDGAYAWMQGDGDFVIYPKGATPPAPGQTTSAVFSSQTSGNHGASLTVEDDGDVVITAPGSTAILWQSGDVPGQVGTGLVGGQQLLPGQYVESADGRYRLENAGRTGVLVLLGPGGDRCVLPREPSHAEPTSSAVMQTDGNFVLYGHGLPTAEWQSATTGNPGATLTLNTQGTLTILSAQGFTLWHAQAGGPAGSSTACR